MSGLVHSERLSAALADRYRIERELGAGGMATVYLAHDIRHDRKVAIKVLKPELAAVLGAERFVVEIKTTAAMSHPHILPLFDSGTADGFLFYVMPYIQGETIREKLNRETQFGVDEAVRIAREVADALDYAHRHGVIHRDIKPENILLHDGRAMVMDFGIALAVSAAAGGRMTETGLSLGTPHYMSPEQATAEKEITARSDQYSLASVLYEMLAGDPPFTASAAQAVIMKIITEQPAAVTERRRNVPANVSAALAKALEKLPADRFESARAFADALGNAGFTTGGASSSARVAATASRAPWLAFAGAALVAVVAIIGWARAVSREEAAGVTPVVRVPLHFSAGEQLSYRAGSLAISPDGERIAYVSDGPKGPRTMVRRTSELVGREIATAELRNLVFSPDGQWIAYSEGAQVRKISAEGGPSTTLARLTSPTVRGLAWSSLDTIVVGGPRALWALPAGGGTVRSLVPPDSFASYNYPVFLDDGRTLLFARRVALQPSRMAVLAAGDTAPVISEMRAKVVLGVRDGRLIYISDDGGLLAIPFNEATRTPFGDAIQLEDSVLAYPRDLGATAALSTNGTLAYVRGLYLSQLVLASENRPEQPLRVDVGEITGPRFSPDGKKVLFDRLDRASAVRSVFVYDMWTETVTRLTDATTNAMYPDWVPDGTRVVFHGHLLGGTDSRGAAIWWMPADGSGKPEILHAPQGTFIDELVAPDGRTVVYQSCSGAARCAIVSAVPGEGGKSTTIVPATEGLGQLRVSPDGKWIAYSSTESGTAEVYVRPYPSGGARVQVSDRGGREPQWSRSGQSIFYRTANALVSVAVRPGALFSVGARDTVLTGDFIIGATTNYDVAPDGKSYLMLKPAYAGARPVVVYNWGRELRERIAGARTP